MIEVLINDVKEKYKELPQRLSHIEGVAKTAELLAKHYNYDVDKAIIAAWFHDYTKYDQIDYQKQFLTQEEIEKYKNFDIMYHAISASKLLQIKYQINDPEILSAIYNHVWGKPNMSILDKIILIADKTEPSRTYDLVYELRKLSFESLDLAIIRFLEDYKIHTINQGYHYPIEVDIIIQELKGA